MPSSSQLIATDLVPPVVLVVNGVEVQAFLSQMSVDRFGEPRAAVTLDVYDVSTLGRAITTGVAPDKQAVLRRRFNLD